MNEERQGAVVLNSGLENSWGKEKVVASCCGGAKLEALGAGGGGGSERTTWKVFKYCICKTQFKIKGDLDF